MRIRRILPTGPPAVAFRNRSMRDHSVLGIQPSTVLPELGQRPAVLRATALIHHASADRSAMPDESPSLHSLAEKQFPSDARWPNPLAPVQTSPGQFPIARTCRFPCFRRPATLTRTGAADREIRLCPGVGRRTSL